MFLIQFSLLNHQVRYICNIRFFKYLSQHKLFNNITMAKNKFSYTMLVLLGTMLAFFSCNEDNYTPLMDVSTKSISLSDDLDSTKLTLTTDNKWYISFDDATIPDWLQIDQTSGIGGTTDIKIKSISLNTTGATRRAIVRISCDNGQARRIKIYQAPKIYPNYNISPKAPDATGMGSTATQLIAKMKLGVNLGNTLELNQWHQPSPTAAYFKFLKQTGFNAVRIPCGWYLQGGNNATAQIPQAWMDSVKTVVQWCVENDMYVLLNIHWDGGWLEGDGNITAAQKDVVIARQKAYWQQIATAFRDFDEHLMFASANEPYSVKSDADAEILVAYHQTCINAVRSTGGRNTYRTIAIQGPEAYIKPDAFFPTDPTPNRLAFEFHNYTPSSFAILDKDPSEGGWGEIFYYWGAGNHSTLEPIHNSTFGEEADQLAYFKSIKTDYIDKGIPCLMGEYSANRRTASSSHVPLELDKHNNSVDAWYTYLTKQCLAIGAKPFFWETGGVFDRVNNTVKDQRTVDAIIAGSK